jgi:hypothetical protein
MTINPIVYDFVSRQSALSYKREKFSKASLDRINKARTASLRALKDNSEKVSSRYHAPLRVCVFLSRASLSISHTIDTHTYV